MSKADLRKAIENAPNTMTKMRKDEEVSMNVLLKTVVLVIETTLVLRVDIGSAEHYVRAFDWRGRELTRKVFKYTTDLEGFNCFHDWLTQICVKHDKNEVIIGCEPTGHYWLTFYQYVI